MPQKTFTSMLLPIFVILGLVALMARALAQTPKPSNPEPLASIAETLPDGRTVAIYTQTDALARALKNTKIVLTETNDTLEIATPRGKKQLIWSDWNHKVVDGVRFVGVGALMPLLKQLGVKIVLPQRPDNFSFVVENQTLRLDVAPKQSQGWHLTNAITALRVMHETLVQRPSNAILQGQNPQWRSRLLVLHTIWPNGGDQTVDSRFVQADENGAFSFSVVAGKYALLGEVPDKSSYRAVASPSMVLAVLRNDWPSINEQWFLSATPKQKQIVIQAGKTNPWR